MLLVPPKTVVSIEKGKPTMLLKRSWLSSEGAPVEGLWLGALVGLGSAISTSLATPVRLRAKTESVKRTKNSSSEGVRSAVKVVSQ